MSASAIDSDSEEEYVPSSLGIILTTPPSKDRDTLTDFSYWRFPIVSCYCEMMPVSPSTAWGSSQTSPLLQQSLSMGSFREGDSRGYNPDQLEALTTAANKLIEKGAVAIITDTGFSAMQKDLANRIEVPVACSAMVQIAALRACVTKGSIGVVTLNRQLISRWHLASINAPNDTPVIGMSPTSPWRNSLPSSPPPVSTIEHCLKDASLSYNSTNHHPLGGIGAGNADLPSREHTPRAQKLVTELSEPHIDKIVTPKPVRPVPIRATTNVRETLFQDLLEATKEIIYRYKVRAVVLEEPRFAPYTIRLQQALHESSLYFERIVVVYDIVSTARWLYMGHRGFRDDPVPRSGVKERREDASIIGDRL